MVRDMPLQGNNSCQDCRCDCGRLLARWTDGGLELKCPRCKRRWMVAEEARMRPAALRPAPESEREVVTCDA